MSILKVEVVRITKISDHPNADLLEIAHIKGWTSVVPKNKFKVGDLAIYFPVESVLPKDLSDRLGVTNYLSNGRVRAASLRGCISFGLLIPIEHEFLDEGQDMTDVYDVHKYEPPESYTDGELDTDHPLFHKYTDIQNHKNHPGIFQEGEQVVVTEKIHGTNSRTGLIVDHDQDMRIMMAGSHDRRIKRPEEGSKASLYWYPSTLPQVGTLLGLISQDFGPAVNIIIFGEIYGSGVNNLQYGLDKGKKAFRVFDVSVNGRYICSQALQVMCDKAELEMVPILYKGPYNYDKMVELAQGDTTIPGAQHIREGIVIKPSRERWDISVGRVILKHISDAHELTKKRTDRH